MKEVIVIIPTYNEKENIGKLIDVLLFLSTSVDLMIVDDSSPDGTADIVQTYREKYGYERIQLISRPEKKGIRDAYLEGFTKVLSQEYAYIIQMDADFSHNPQDISKLLMCCKKEKQHIAIGSRYIKGINVVDWPIGRVLMSYFSCQFVKFITRMPIQDPTSGFVCYKKEVLANIMMNKIHSKGYAFQIEMKFQAWKIGFSIQEVSIIFTNRVKGKSKMSLKIFNEAFWNVIRIKCNSLLMKHPPLTPNEVSSTLQGDIENLCE